MTFMRKFDTILQKSNKTIYKIDSDDGINLSYFNENFELLSSRKLCNVDFSFLDYWFDVDSLDNIYGIINNKKGNLIYCNITKNFLVKSNLLKYNPDLRFLKFVYIKSTKENSNVFYYSLDIKKPYHGFLIHHQRKHNKWNTYIVDSISYNVLTNYVVIYDSDMNPTIFFYNTIDGCVELFASIFSNNTDNWSQPIQITHSKKPKIYLSVIKDEKDCYHILFSENNNSKYYCTYITGFINDNNFNTINTCVISDTVACTFPNIIEYNNSLFANWIEYHTLYYCSSKDYGNTWSTISISNESSTDPFVCCNYKINPQIKNTINYFTIFTKINSNKVLGIK